MRNHLFILILFLSIPLVMAHQPRFPVSDKDTFIQNPEISQAFYAELKGTPEFYIVNETKPFALYVQLLVINISDINKQFVVTITQDDKIIAILDNSEANWTLFHEEFANDDYWNGPEYRGNATGGYTITVTNSDLKGKYVLVIGDKESFPLSEIVRTIGVLPELKIFMNKTPLLAYWNLSGFFILITLLIIAAIIYFIFRTRSKK